MRKGVIGRAFKAAFPLTVPIATGFLFLGSSYGLLMHSQGFGFWWPVCMAFFIFAGSMEFVTVNLLLSAFNPVAAFLLALMVNARHLFYGLSMLGKFRGIGWKKPYLIFAMCDETFAINSSARIPDGVDRGWFMLFVSVLNRWYWIVGAALGWLIGGVLPFSTKGIEFVLTALFLTIFLDQWMGGKRLVRNARGRFGGHAGRAARDEAVARLKRYAGRHLPAAVGVLASLACLIALGPDRFMVPSMALMLVLFLALRPYLDGPADGTDPGSVGSETVGSGDEGGEDKEAAR
ncbi:AzlC family ABC transporter permease [Bifidobacterium avesanii]|uniref:Branched-chain amino acid ABC transporter permease n=1 Tax=Bifidobacterium avesanii TaxID=1798157 RepID=A0A7K3TFV5_9BIFI|nr:AzlC family ABC transporter permease [Bifidobacterium avesanii]KAB8291435.1 branched-chain amino acid transport protein [Bifidobacterium avesanii]NEG77932.1 branched-chain amino acid ABC transporter permease [Bifidobacterium avesanii]